MKKLLFAVILALVAIFGQAQPQPQPQPRPDTVIQGRTYPILTGPRGGRYIVVTSKTGTQYKRYLKPKP